MAIANRLKQIRMREYMMNQIEFAEYLGIDKSQYNRYENQKNQPTMEIALIISGKLNRSVNEIFVRVE